MNINTGLERCITGTAAIKKMRCLKKNFKKKLPTYLPYLFGPLQETICLGLILWLINHCFALLTSLFDAMLSHLMDLLVCVCVK